MTITKLGKSSVKMTFCEQEASIIEEAFYTYNHRLSSKIIIVWLIICVQNRYEIKIGKNVTIELLKNGQEATLYISGYTPKYHISENMTNTYKCRIKKQLVCYFEDTDKLKKFAKFIYCQDYAIKQDSLYSDKKGYLLIIDGNIPTEIICEYCYDYQTAANKSIDKSHNKLIRENGAIKAIAEL